MKTHCVNGHEYTEENTIHKKHYNERLNKTYTVRNCRTCATAAKRRSYRKLREEAGFEMSYPLKTHCRKGHAMDEKNTYHYQRVRNGKPSPIRICRKCAAIDSARQRQDRLKAIPCHDCKETGRIKATAMRGHLVRYFCHDEEKSCYNYRRGTYFTY